MSSEPAKHTKVASNGEDRLWRYQHRAAALAEAVASAYGVPADFLRNPEREVTFATCTPAERAFRAVVHKHFMRFNAHRMLGQTFRGCVAARCRRWFDEQVAAGDAVAMQADAQAATAAAVSDAAEGPWYPVADWDGRFDQGVAAAVLGISRANAGMALKSGLGRLRKGAAAIKADRKDLGYGLRRAMTTRALACAIYDLAEAAGVDSMELAKVFVKRYHEKAVTMV